MREPAGECVERVCDQGQWFDPGLRVEFFRVHPRHRALEPAALGSYEVLACTRVENESGTWLDVRLRRAVHTTRLCTPRSRERDERRRVLTEEQAERLYRARRHGGLCAACGRDLAADETVYIERFEDARGRRTSQLVGPVGVECSSDALRRAAPRRDPEWCAACGRPMYDRVGHTARTRAVCSQQCRRRAPKLQAGGGDVPTSSRVDPPARCRRNDTARILTQVGQPGHGPCR